MPSLRWPPLAALLAVAACIAGDRAAPVGPDFAISDGAHSGGTPGFFFLPPMVSKPAVTGVFDADIATVNPVVVICDVTDGPDVACGAATPGATPALRVFTTTSTPAITVEFDKYKVNWDTKEGAFAAGRTYRLHVLAGTPSRQLGFADILLTTEPGKVKKLADGEFVVLNDGRTLPIHFRIEQGVIVPAGPARVFELTGLPASLTSGTLASVTVTARDENGNVAIGYRGTVAFRSSDPQATLPANYTFTDADAGVHTFADAVSFKTAGAVTLRVADVADAGIFGEASLTVLPLDAVSLEASGLSDPTAAGATNSITVTARDAHGNVATGYTGTIAFISNDPQAALPENYTFTAADAGTHAFPASVTLRTVGSTTVAATDDAVDTITGAQTVTVIAAGAAEFVLSGIPDHPVAGVAYDLTVTARDPFGNTAIGYTGTVQFSSSDPAATLPDAYQLQPADAGVRSFPGGVSFRTAGLQTLQANDAAVPAIAGSVSRTVDPAAATELRFTTQLTDAAAGTPIAPPVVITAYDQFGNVATGFTAQVIVAIGANPAAGVLAGTTQVAAVLGVATLDDLSINAAGNGYTLVVSATGLTDATSGPFHITALGAVSLQVSGLGDPTVAGAPGSITVTARDQHGNIAPTYTGTVAFTSTDPQATLPGEYTFTADDAGSHTFTASVTLRTAGSSTVIATDQAVTGAQSVAVVAAAAAEFVLEGIPDPAVAGVAYDLTVTARDAFANTATGYAGTVQFSSGDPAATVPAAYQFQPGDAGVRTFTGAVTFRTAGLQSFQATDATIPATTSVAVSVDPAAAAQLRFTTQPTDAPEGTPIAPPVVVTAFDEFGNVADGFAGQVTIAIGTNPSAGVLSGTLQVNALLGVATFSNLNISADGAGYTLVAAATGVTSATSDPFTVTALAPTDVHWINAVSGSWSDGTKWSTGAAPTPDQAVFIDANGTYTVTLDVNATVNSLTLGAASGVQTLSAGSNRILAVSTSGTILPAGRLMLNGAALNGPGAVTNAGVVHLINGDITSPFTNQGTLISEGAGSTITGTLNTQPGSLMRLLGTSSGSSGWAILTVAAGFTNQGTIELAVTHPGALVTLTVSSGTLVNAPGATISLPAGAGAGVRTLAAQLDNQGTLDVGAPLTLNRPSADHLNSGVVTLTGGNLTVNQSGTTPSFTNTGTVTVPAGRSWTISGTGSFTQAPGATLDGGGAMILIGVNPAVFGSAFTLSALSLNNTTASFATDITTETLALTLNNSTVNGPGTLTNAAGKTLTLNSTDIHAPLVNAGTLVSLVNSSVNGIFTTQTGSLLRLLGTSSGSSGWAFLTVASGFTNQGTIELAVSHPGALVTLTVSSGTLVNAPGATISLPAGAGAGVRTLAAQLDNQGTLDVGAPLTLNRVSADHLNSGVVTLTGGNLTVSQSGTTPSFTNTGTITVPAGRTWIVTSGSVTHAVGATLNGGGGLALVSVTSAVFDAPFTLAGMNLFNTTASFAADITTETMALVLTGSVVNGPGTLTNAAGKSLTLNRSDINAPLVNAGTLVSVANSMVNGAFTTGAGSVLRVQGFFDGNFNTSSSLTVAGGFTNNGAIELTNSAVNTNATLTVTSGTLVNAAGATISALVGAGGGTRTLAAQLDNQGTLDVGAPLTLNRPSADHLNSGVVTLTGGNLTVSQTGTTPSFTNTGTVTVPTGRSWTISGTGSFTQATGATLDGGGAMILVGVNPAVFGSAFSLSALSLNNTTASFATDITTETLALTLNNSTVNGPGTLTNAAGKTLTLNSTDIHAPLVNAGTLVSLRSSSVNGAFTTGAGSVLRVQGYFDGFFNTSSSLTVAGGFTNHGAIELTNSAVNTNATLTVTSGTLVNAAGATISALTGTGGGSRTLTAQLDNQGTLTVAHPLTINRGSADHANTGTIAVTGGDLTITQSGTTPSFTNSGLIDVAATRALRIAVGPFANLAGASIQGAGTFEAGASTPFSNAGSVTVTLMRIGNALTGAGTFAPVTAEFFSNATIIPGGAGYSYTNVRVLNAASFTGSTSLAGNLTVAGSGNLTIGGNEIAVGGNFATQSTSVLTMQNAAGVLAVTGDATFSGGSTNTRLTAGTLRVAGDFVQSGSAAAFAATLNHVTVLNGAATQSVSFANPGTTTTLSHFQRLEIDNASAAGVTLGSAAFANGQLRTPAGPSVQRTLSSAGLTLQVGGLDAVGLVLDGTPLRVVNGGALTRFDDAIFRNMNPTVTQFRLDRLADVVTFNNIQFLTAPTTGVYLHLVDTDLAAPLFTVTMAGTQPPNHGGKVIESVAGQLLGWPF